MIRFILDPSNQSPTHTPPLRPDSEGAIRGAGDQHGIVWAELNTLTKYHNKLKSIERCKIIFIT